MKTALFFSVVLTLAFSNIRCASIVHGEDQNVVFKNAPEGVTTVQSPKGEMKIEKTPQMLTLKRSKSNIPVTFTCPNNEKKSTELETSFSWGWGFFGNFVFGGVIGWFIDPMSDRGYNIDEVDLAKVCSSNREVAEDKGSR